MEKKLTNFLLIVLLAAGLLFHAVDVRADYELSEHELALLNLVNQARANPRAAILAAGLDPGTIVEKLPVLACALDVGMKPFAVHPKLNSAASKHTQDMFKHNFYGHVLPDGLSIEQKVLGQNYPAIKVRLSLGNVVFQNFIAPEDAVWKVFKSMLLEELNSDDGTKLVLFNPDHKEVGVSLIAGEMAFGGQNRNVYLASCFSGYSFSGQVSDTLLEMLNMLRYRPDYEIQEIDSNLRGMPPLAEQSELISAGLSHVFEMENIFYYDPVSPDGVTPSDRISRFGYDASKISNALAFVEVQEGLSVRDYASELFQQLMLQELLSPTGPEHILNRELSEAGLAVGIIMVETSPENQTFYLLLSAHLTKPVTPRLFAMGGAYSPAADESGNEYWKGIQGLKVDLATLAGDVVIRCDVTGPAGLFQIPITPGMYKINLIDNNLIIASKPIIMPQENILLNFWLREYRVYE